MSRELLLNDSQLKKCTLESSLQEMVHLQTLQAVNTSVLTFMWGVTIQYL